LGLAFFHESGHPFFLVVGGEEEIEEPSLKEHTLIQRRLKGLVHSLLGHAQGDWRFGGHRGGDFDGNGQDDVLFHGDPSTRGRIWLFG